MMEYITRDEIAFLSNISIYLVQWKKALISLKITLIEILFRFDSNLRKSDDTCNLIEIITQ